MDPVREQYYWHRFFHHQPDLNFDNPQCRTPCSTSFLADLGARRFPLTRAVSVRARCSNGENLPETHDYFEAGRQTVDTRVPGRAPPQRRTSGRPTSSSTSATATSATCASTSRSCPACSWRCAASSASRSPRSWPRRPTSRTGAQWGIFLRNHDELTLEMVTDEERDYMYSEYAQDPLMRRNIGIARRLFPLIEQRPPASPSSSTRCFSMPGSPVMYYGDEIGMGDNIYLGDRDSVRTPMQWTPDRNAGFSKADFTVYLLPLMDRCTATKAVNVEGETRNPSSFLHWLRRMLAVRREHLVLGIGALGRCCRRRTRRSRHFGAVRQARTATRLLAPAAAGRVMVSQLAGKIPVETLTGAVSASVSCPTSSHCIRTALLVHAC